MDLLVHLDLASLDTKYELPGPSFSTALSLKSCVLACMPKGHPPGKNYVNITTIHINLEAGGAHCVVLLNDVLRPSNGCLLELGISPIRAGPWSSNVDTVVIEHQVRVGDVQSSADVHQLVEVHDRGLEAPTEAVIEEPIPAREPRPCGQDRLWLGLYCVWRGSPLIAVGFLTPRIAQ